MKTETENFLAALLFTQPENEEGEIEFADKSVHDFSPAFIAAVDQFIAGFESYLSEREIEIPEIERSFGGNVYFSLTGHGVGFWDDGETAHLQGHLEAYSGNKYRFEHIDIYEHENGELDLSVLPEYLDERRKYFFAVNVNA